VRLLSTALLLLLLLPAAADAARLGDRTLQRGHRGADVRELQRLLTRVGLRTGADGVFGRLTHRNVHRYERRHRLAVDGRVSTGQARGLLRRAGRPVPPGFGRPRAAAVPGAARFPVDGAVRWGDGFGDRGGRHQGIDLLAACGLPVVATHDGEVTRVASHANAGRYVVLRTAAGHDAVSMHLASVAVRAGTRVAAGERLGTVGRTGNASACHLHFERWTAPGWHRGGAPEDPEPELRASYPRRSH
jgi:murein DD-endopeptidase MepM/ murein hydrolase activator NlpD